MKISPNENSKYDLMVIFNYKKCCTTAEISRKHCEKLSCLNMNLFFKTMMVYYN